MKLDSFWLVFAVYRLSRLLTIDEGPASMFLKLRTRLGAYDYDVRGQAETSIGRGISCPHCVGIYMAIVLWVLWRVERVRPAIQILGLAGAQSFLQAIGNGES